MFSLPTGLTNPLPGFITLATITPMISANVLTISKYNNAFPPTLPTFFISLIPAMPNTMVKNMMGAISIVIRLMNVWPDKFRCRAE